MLIEESKNQVAITVNPKIYPLEAIYSAAYVFLSRAYIFLDENDKKEILITIKARKKLNQTELDDLDGEFHNELLNYTLRYEISKNNKKIREYIVGRALIGAIGKNGGGDIDEEGLKDMEEYIDEDIEEWKGDDLGISLPWEKQTKKTTKKKAK